jgi:hypothetical protein
VSGRRRPAIAVVSLALCLVGAGCGGGDDDKASGATGSSTSVAGGTTTTASGEGSSSTTTVEGAGPSTTARSGGPATTAAPATTPPTGPPATPAPGPVALTPPAAGTYSYATSGATTVTGAPIPINIPFPPVTTNVIDPPAGARQHSQRRLVDASGNGSVIDYVFEYRADGVYLVSLTFTTTFSGQSDVQTLAPPAPLLFLATGAGPGSSQTLDIAVGAGTARVVVDVPRTEVVTVGGQAIETLVVRSAAQLPPGAITGTQTITVNLDRGSRLWVRETGLGDGTAAVGGFNLVVHSDYTARIERLTP